VDHQTDLLDRVVAELANRKGDLLKVSRESGVAYDTVLRIKNRENDPGYSKVRALAVYFGFLPADAHDPALVRAAA
jgi:hypothetical protein